MNQQTMTILYVENPAASAGFYENVLGKPPLEASPGFAMFALNPASMLGLWRRSAVVPPATPAGGGEIAFTAADGAAVDAMHRDWNARGIAIAQPPADMDFGRTFVGLDPDRHRLRVFAPVRP